MRLNGWQRVGIVLSVLWALGVWVYMDAIGEQAAQKAMTDWNNVCTERKLTQNELDLKSCIDTAVKLAEYKRADWSGVPLITALVPIPVVWLLVYIVVWTMRWIRRGFQPTA
jgi:hypothetical protein